jgi:hypothetical protein
MQPFLETFEGAELRIANLYITPQQQSQPSERAKSIHRYILVNKSRIWMHNITLEGADDMLVEGVDVFGSTSMPSRIFAQGTLHTP